MKNRRYPGVRPFETADRNLFFGRERDVHDLGVLIALEKLVVLFGKSGYGKSSLINAGIIPQLAEMDGENDVPILPILVRLGSYTENASQSPLQILLTRLAEKTTANPAADFLKNWLPDESLWFQIKRRSNGSMRLLFIFDQFEEFFTWPFAEQQNFKSQLAEVIYSEIPQSIREAAPNLDKNQRRFLAEPLEVKVLFAIRADRMSQLDSLKDRLPAILHKRYELKGLTDEQARQAIEKPASQPGDFVSPAFTYSPESLRLVLEKLGESRQIGHHGGIEAFQLQIVCEFLEGEIMAGRIHQNRIESSFLAGRIDEIYEGYYQRLLDRLPASVAHAAQRLIEESLLFEDEKTGESRRLSVDAEVLVRRHASEGVSQETLRQLENTFLLRREANSVGGFSYEISHDTLLGAVLRRKKERTVEEDRQKAAELDRQHRKREYGQRLRLAGSIGFAVLGFALAGIAWRKSGEAEQARSTAVLAQKQAEESLKALQNEQNRSKAIELENYGEGYFNLGKFQDALENYRKAQELMPDNLKLKQKIESCQLKLKNQPSR